MKKKSNQIKTEGAEIGLRYGVVLKTYTTQDWKKYYPPQLNSLDKETVLKKGTPFISWALLTTKDGSYYASHNNAFRYIIPAELVMELTEEEYKVFKQLEKEDV